MVTMKKIGKFSQYSTTCFPENEKTTKTKQNKQKKKAEGRQKEIKKKKKILQSSTGLISFCKLSKMMKILLLCVLGGVDGGYVCGGVCACGSYQPALKY